MKTFTLRTLIVLPPDTHHLNIDLDFIKCFVSACAVLNENLIALFGKITKGNHTVECHFLFSSEVIKAKFKLELKSITKFYVWYHAVLVLFQLWSMG